jgi:uncharacterized membrane protein YeaQ/YmgE (transglycosylase-associated protein family)
MESTRFPMESARFQESIMFLGILGWIIIGVGVGYVFSRLLNLHGDDPRLSLAAGAAGALLGGTAYTLISGSSVQRFELWSMIFAAIGSVAGLAAWHVVRSRYVSRAAYVRRRSY